MANPTQPDVGSSITVSPSNPDRQNPYREKSPIVPPPPSFAATPRFPLPRLQQDQASSPSMRTPPVLSPANGVKTGSPVPHLSTPPGPPVFSKPVLPAAVPFRTSPASPQPVALSSASSFPTSSSSQFSNGSFELQQHQVSDVTKDQVPLGESSYVLFSAHKVYFRIVYFLLRSWFWC